jgi:serine/threonine-protein kinase
MIGSVIGGKYRIIRRLGGGGMGSVYLGEHTVIKRRVAIKCLNNRYSHREDLTTRFHREALAANAVDSEHIVEVTDMGNLDDGTMFMVLEYLEGRDLSNLIEESGQLPFSRVINIVLQICNALAKVHEKGIIHRDLKPSNIYLLKRDSNPDFVKILDFGVSKFKVSLDGKKTELTAIGETFGTPYYMSPEQVEGGCAVDSRTDIYSLGCIIFNALTGIYPFDADSLTLLLCSICTQPPPPLRLYRPDIPEAFERVWLKTMAKQKERRYSDCRELREALLHFLGRTETDRFVGGARLGDTYSYGQSPVSPVSDTNVEDDLDGIEKKWPAYAMLAVLCLLVGLTWVGFESGAVQKARSSRQKSVKPSLTFPKAETEIAAEGLSVSSALMFDNPQTKSEYIEIKEKEKAAPKVVNNRKKKPVEKRPPRPEVSREVPEPPQKSDDHEEEQEQDEQSSEPEVFVQKHKGTENPATKEKLEKWSELKRIF